MWELHSSVFKTLGGFQERLGYRFKDLHLLYEALTHRTAVTELSSFAPSGGEYGIPWNERLEFLGDTVLGLSVSHRLMVRPECFSEGELSRIRASLVNEASLAETATDLGLGDSIVLGKGEERSGARDRQSLLADAMEAVFGAIFSDSGYQEADAVIGKLFHKRLTSDVLLLVQTDYKTMLQEVTQEKLKVTPQYDVTNESGPDHSKVFEVTVKVNGETKGSGSGVSKKRASQAAARVALEKIVGESR